jgi:hypothetical protein
MGIGVFQTAYTADADDVAMNQLSKWYQENWELVPDDVKASYQSDLDEWHSLSFEDKEDEGYPNKVDYVIDAMDSNPEFNALVGQTLPDPDFVTGQEVTTAEAHGSKFAGIVSRLVIGSLVNTATGGLGGFLAGDALSVYGAAAIQTAGFGISEGLTNELVDEPLDFQQAQDSDLTDPDADITEADDSDLQAAFDIFDEFLLNAPEPTSSPVDFNPPEDTTQQAQVEAGDTGGILSEPTAGSGEETSGAGGDTGSQEQEGQVFDTPPILQPDNPIEIEEDDVPPEEDDNSLILFPDIFGGGDTTTDVPQADGTTGDGNVAFGDFLDDLLDQAPDILGDLAGGAINQIFVDQSQGDLKEAAEVFAESAKFKPFDVETAAGKATFDAEAGKVVGTLSPEIQGLLDQQLGIAQESLEATSAFGTGEDAIDRELGLLNRLSSQRRQTDINQFFDRLQGQGRTGTTGGQLQTTGFLDALTQNDLRRELAAINSARSESSRLNQVSTNATNQALNLSQATLPNIELGANIGVGAASSNVAANAPLFNVGVQGAFDTRETGRGIASGTRDFVFNAGRSLFS